VESLLEEKEVKKAQTSMCYIRIAISKDEVTMRSLHHVHEMNAKRAGPVCPHDSTLEPLDGFR
jgi:hypothetical protein